MAKHNWKKRLAMTRRQRNLARAITTRWFRTLPPSIKRSVSMLYNDYNALLTEGDELWVGKIRDMRETAGNQLLRRGGQ